MAVLTKGKATYRLIISLIWLAGIFYIFWTMSAVPKGGWHNNHDVLELGDLWVVIAFAGFLGLFQCLFQGKAFILYAVGIMLGSLFSGPSVEYEYENIATGEKYRKPADGGCIGSIIAGLVIVFASALIASPVVFSYNFYNFVIAWTYKTRFAKFIRYVTILFLCTFLVGSLYGSVWLYRQVEEVSRYKKVRGSHSLVIPQTYSPQEIAGYRSGV